MSRECLNVDTTSTHSNADGTGGGGGGGGEWIEHCFEPHDAFLDGTALEDLPPHPAINTEDGLPDRAWLYRLLRDLIHRSIGLPGVQSSLDYAFDRLREFGRMVTFDYSCPNGHDCVPAIDQDGDRHILCASRKSPERRRIEGSDWFEPGVVMDRYEAIDLHNLHDEDVTSKAPGKVQKSYYVRERQRGHGSSDVSRLVQTSSPRT